MKLKKQARNEDDLLMKISARTFLVALLLIVTFLLYIRSTPEEPPPPPKPPASEPYPLTTMGLYASRMPQVEALPNKERLSLADGHEVVLEIAGNYFPPAFGSICIEIFKVTVEEWSGGRIKIIHYPDAMMGSDLSIIRAIQRGSFAMGFMATAPLVSFIPAVSVFDMGSYGEDYNASARTMQNGPFRRRMEREYNKSGFELLALFPSGYRDLGSIRPVRCFEDIAGLKIRTMENETHAAFWRCMGAKPHPLPMGEVYVALQQHIIDASENPYDTMLINKIYDQTPYFTETRHILFNHTMIFNKEMWEDLPADYRVMILSAATAMAEWGVENGHSNILAAKKKLIESGCEIIPFPVGERAKMRAAARPVYQLVRETIGDDIVDLWVSELEKNRQSWPPSDAPSSTQ